MTGKLENLKRILAIGPATLVSVAYIDPGNFGTNIEAGSKYGLTLLWVVWLSGAMAIMFQYISGKVGIVTEKGLLDVSMAKLRKNEKKLYFFGLFIAILATDMAEFVGMAVGFHLILGIPLSISAGLSVVDVLLLFLLTEDLGRMEIVIAGLVGIVGLSYLIELVIVHANPEEILMHSFIPYLSGSEMILTATSIIGATIMPHAIILHSYLSAEKSAGKGGINKKGEIKNHLKETLANLGGASLVNAAIQIMSYYAFYLKGLTNITSLESAYYTLAPLFGALASWIFAISLFSSGLSSSMVSVIAGVKILESYFGTPTKQWKVRLMLRLINMVPFLIAVYLGVDMMSILVYTQAILSFSLPLVLFPLINISKDGNLMGGYKISKPLYVISLVSTVFIVLINIAMFVF
ncbi:Nramp family divalent metal transporter [Fervidicoccus fontis]|uniref:Nramp family divalent metal transporter n=1 Tax=Fervidicoccus fontis TaxID=683846 RepID=A0A843AA31_9CREN|nr:Nramp family divalent metal transporter [Fervidicoccus fontis]MBE9390924.1 Nramp family divalent metal transporter [Fervidicoccus fontis]